MKPHGPSSIISYVQYYVIFLIGIMLAPASFANEKRIYQVLQGDDDAEEYINHASKLGEVDLNSSDLELGQEKSKQNTAQLVGVRFQNIELDADTEILSAYIQFTVDETKNNDPFTVTIKAQAHDNAPAFSQTTGNISSRATTSNIVEWSNEPRWNDKHSLKRSPDIKALVKEVISRDGWKKGNAMSFLIEGYGTRTAESYEGSMSHLDVNDYAPQLIITVPSRVSFQVNSSNSDAEERIKTGKVSTTSSDLEIGYEKQADKYAQLTGTRFTDVSLPKGATILSASVQFAQDESKNNNPFSVSIYGEATADADVYRKNKKDISKRTRTKHSVRWENVADWTVLHEAGQAQKTPDLTAIIQEIVDQPDWKEGNSLALMFEGVGTRTAESFDGSSSLAPVLNVTFVGELTSPSVDKVRLVWVQDPTTTMTIVWDQLRGSNATVYYAPYNGQTCSTDLNTYTKQQPVESVISAYDMNNARATISGLNPDSAYQFVIADSETVSDCMWFRTAPATPKPFTFISGGDSKSSGNALEVGRWSNQMVSKVRPLFVLFTGDFNSGNGTNAARWKQWLSDWSTLTRSSDGRMYPIIPMHGNHEDGDFSVLYKLFAAGNDDPAQSSDYTYYALTFGGDLLRVYNLNSQLWLNHKKTAHTIQNQWFENDLKNSQHLALRIAGYHKPMRPHTKSKSENDFLVDAWAPLYQQYKVGVVYESDTHNHVLTFPIRLAQDFEEGDMEFIRDDTAGTIHVGEGSWGATPRSNNDDKSWTLDSAAFNQIKLNHVYPSEQGKPARIDIRSIKTAQYINGELVNFVADVAENTEADPLALPQGVQVHNIPFYGDHISYPFKAIDGDAPSAPVNVQARATGYFDTEIIWDNTAAIDTVRSIQIERRVGLNGHWVLLNGSLAADTTRFNESNLSDDTQYFYRLRTSNVFGVSEWSDVVSVTTPKDPRVNVEFRQGLNDYSGSSVRVIASSDPDASFTGSEVTIDQQTSDYNGSGASQGLIRFDELFGANALPNNAVIDSAQLRFYTTSSTSGPIALHRMLQPWGDDVSWNALGAGIQADDIDANAQADSRLANIGSRRYTVFDVTESVRAWAQGQGNYGWAILNASGDGWDFPTERYLGAPERRPTLVVFYTLKGDIDGNGRVERQDLMTMRRYVRQPASACPRCDIDGDGVIGMTDMRRLMLIIRNAQ